jgi:tRNA (guanine37-N1)-methyltransferase
MRIDVVTIFPAYLDALQQSLPGKAIANGTVQLGVHDLRNWTHDVHKSVDDSPYGGGPGMVMKAPIWGAALDEICTPETVLVVPTPAGRLFTQEHAHRWTEERHLVFACGRYEGIDQRVLDRHVDIELSLGDFVLSGGELPALALLDAVARLQEGVLGDARSHEQDSFSDGLLDCPHYSRPEVLGEGAEARPVPPVLMSGHHADIARWRRQQSLALTARRRPDLIAAARAAGKLTPADEKHLAALGL